jgi:ADP-ribose pyrophosphatase
MAHKILKRRKFFQGKVFSLLEVQLELPDHTLSDYDLLVHPGSVTIIPFDEQGNIHFVKQYRLGAEKELLELPAGTLELNEIPKKCAMRELREETGMAAGKLVELGDLYLCPGYSTEHMHIFLATNLNSAPLSGDKDEFIQPKLIPLSKVEKMIATNQINDGKSLAALMLAWSHLQKLANNKK